MLKVLFYLLLGIVYVICYDRYADAAVQAWIAHWPRLLSQLMFIVVLLPVMVCVGLAVQAGQNRKRPR